MHVEIEIVCENEEELLAHLSDIRQKVKRAIKKAGGEITTPETLKYSNCYGDHTVNIIPMCSMASDNNGHFPDGNGFCLSCGKQLMYDSK